MIYRILAAIARFDQAVCEHFYGLTKSDYWRQARDRAAQDVDKFERDELIRVINQEGTEA